MRSCSDSFRPFLILVLEAIFSFSLLLLSENDNRKATAHWCKAFFDDEWILLVDLLEIPHEGGRFEWRDTCMLTVCVV